jgi:hypothetical protein
MTQHEKNREKRETNQDAADDGPVERKTRIPSNEDVVKKNCDFENHADGQEPELDCGRHDA